MSLEFDYYKQECALLEREEDRIWEITRYNFAVLGSLVLVSSLLNAEKPALASATILVVLATIAATSLAAAGMVIFHRAYWVYLEKRVMFLDTIVQQNKRLDDPANTAGFEELKQKRKKADSFLWSLGAGAVYVVTYINLVPMGVAGLALWAARHFGLVT